MKDSLSARAKPGDGFPPLPLMHTFKRMLDAVIFDVDGTLVDSVDIHAEAWSEAFAHFDFNVPTRAVRPHMGKGGDHLLPVFLSQKDIERVGAKLEKFRGELFAKKYLGRIKPFPSVRELFLALKQRGIRRALASSSRSEELEQYKAIANIADLVDEETSRDDAEQSKPDPDIFQAACGDSGR